MKARDLRQLSIQELEAKLKELKTELFKLRITKKIEGLKEPSKIRDTKRDIARILTVINEKKRGQAV
ncbi:MAG: 50S ribosomal protein L29 [Hydrogenobaculum sp.]|jgi:large subunit ribosomal protein L29|uniref:50S ribosomal protein L29 n=1 Tax=unclassified Hydrogenobaculum TaxID=2622382 RepID=UPI0001C52220|nr:MULTISPECIES: 50S ribosomal protein L29 [unclassified Hydrogenobaculum]AEF18677.1 ribosomal protein L29 [Hydrogenobaculum sp. 3684]AEG45965.1 ribosomal protein L29 [Hydrogenobaculum sp. SHO]AGG14608.1 LSU ribosomal protein L29P [Hydrogenobaculum sp. HO]AGH92907.1 ribosomal protein L29 [Hydrogenobaculum sp. SN]